MAATEAPFETQLKHFAPVSDLPSIRNQMAKLESDLSDAVHDQDYTVAAMLRDDLAELQSKDPSFLASDLRGRLEALVGQESYTEAATMRDQLMVLRRFQPQYQLAGLWKGAPAARCTAGLRGRRVEPGRLNVWRWGEGGGESGGAKELEWPGNAAWLMMARASRCSSVAAG
jgi:hypothetical protein